MLPIFLVHYHGENKVMKIVHFENLKIVQFENNMRIASKGLPSPPVKCLVSPYKTLSPS